MRSTTKAPQRIAFDEKHITDFIEANIGKMPGGEPATDRSSDPYELPRMHLQIKQDPRQGGQRRGVEK